jgi:uncharacterized protein YndB with AHSA1/START domain
MTIHKDFKRLVRARMRKTGESYTAARAQLLSKKAQRSARQPASPPARDYAKLGGKSDAILKARTGCTWERWVKALDHVKAHAWTHPEIAAYIVKTYKIPGWWAQSVTVGYERIKGLRAVGQRRDGSFEASKSKTFPVPLGTLYSAFDNPRLRARWLPGVGLTVRTATPEKSMRITWPDETSVEVLFDSQGAGKSRVALAHVKLADEAAKTQAKAYWGERLEALKDVLGPGDVENGTPAPTSLRKRQPRRSET